jgi:hypothetical protein
MTELLAKESRYAQCAARYGKGGRAFELPEFPKKVATLKPRDNGGDSQAPKIRL